MAYLPNYKRFIRHAWDYGERYQRAEKFLLATKVVTLLTADVNGTGIPGVYFDGSNDAYGGPSTNDDLDGDSDRTIEAWFYNPATGGEETLVALGRRSNRANFAMLCQPGTPYGALTDYETNLGWSSGPSAGSWHHAVAVYDGERGVKVYLDGVESNSKMMVQDYSTFRDLMAIGQQRDNNGNLTGYGFSGYINTVRVHGGELSAAQVLSNYNLGPEVSGEPTLLTQAATFVRHDRATMSAKVRPNGSTTTVYFEWGTTAAYGNQTDPQELGGLLTPETT